MLCDIGISHHYLGNFTIFQMKCRYSAWKVCTCYPKAGYLCRKPERSITAPAAVYRLFPIANRRAAQGHSSPPAPTTPPAPSHHPGCNHL